MLWLIDFRVIVREISRKKNFKKTSQQNNNETLYFQGRSESNNPQHFLKELNKIFWMLLNNSLKL